MNINTRQIVTEKYFARGKYSIVRAKKQLRKKSKTIKEMKRNYGDALKQYNNI